MARKGISGIAVLLLLGAAIAVGAGCGSDGGSVTETETVTTTAEDTTAEDTTATTSTEDTTAATDTTATTTQTTPPTTEKLSVFRSPSGNIGCQMTSAGVRCDIRHHTYADPPAFDCNLDSGDSLGVENGIGHFVCHGDTAIDPSSPQVPYGDNVANGAFVCDSEESGMRCENTDTGHGFELSIQAARTF